MSILQWLMQKVDLVVTEKVEALATAGAGVTTAAAEVGVVTAAAAAEVGAATAAAEVGAATAGAKTMVVIAATIAGLEKRIRPQSHPIYGAAAATFI